MLEDTRTSESEPCCKIPLERAEAIVVELEEASLIADQLGQALESERRKRERVYNALAELVGEKRATQIAEGEESPPQPARDTQSPRAGRPRTEPGSSPREVSVSIAGLAMGIALPV